MSRLLSRRQVLRGALGLSTAGALVPGARACEFFSTTMRIYHPWTCASEPGATTAVVCMRFDEVQEDDQLIGARSPLCTGARLGLAEGAASVGSALPALPLEIPAGRETLLSEKGRHLLLTGLTQPLLVGRAYPMTLSFARGGEVAAQLTVDYPSFRFL